MRVAVVQSSSRPGRLVDNVERVREYLADAHRRRASLVVFPEMFLSGYEVWDRLAELSLDPGAPALRRIAEDARRYGLAVLVGYPERRRHAIYNAACVIDHRGDIQASYHKIHLFGREREHFVPGRRYRLLRVGPLTVGVLICYDLEFPEPARVLALRGAQLIAVCTANMTPYAYAQDVLVRARALENQVYLALANHVGHEKRTTFVGGSGIWDPTGSPIVCEPRNEGLLVSDLDTRRLTSARRAFDYLRERRPECYRPLVGTSGAARRQ